MGTRADRLNRLLLSLLALLLVLGGAAGLLASAGVFGNDVSQRLVLDPRVGDTVQQQAGWLWPVVALVFVLLSLLALRWLLAQLRTDRVDDVDLTTARRFGETRVTTAAVTEALVDAVEPLVGVERASARVVRIRRRQWLVLDVRLADRADPGATRAALGGPLADLRRVLGEDCPPVRVDLEPSTQGSSRMVS